MTLSQCLKSTSKQIYGKTNTHCLQHCDQIFGLMNTFIYIRPSMSSCRCSSWIQKGQRSQRSNCQHLLDHRKREFQKNIYFCFIDYCKAFDSVNHNKLCKILKEMGIPDHLTCLLRNLYTGQETTVRTRHGTMDWFQTGKGLHQGCILSPCLFYLYAEHIM